MNKEFVPYEQALALKELGFDEPCLGYFDIQYNGFTQSSSGRLILGKDPDTLQCTKKMLYIHGQLKILAPTFSQAFRWFKDKYNLFYEIQIDKTAEPKYWINIFKYEHFGNYEELRVGEWFLYRTQEEAEFECLKKLIQIIKNK